MFIKIFKFKRESISSNVRTPSYNFILVNIIDTYKLEMKIFSRGICVYKNVSNIFIFYQE